MIMHYYFFPIAIPIVFGFVPDRYKFAGICGKIVSEDPFILKYCVDRYNTQEMRDKAVDAFLPALKFVPDWFLTKKNLLKNVMMLNFLMMIKYFLMKIMVMSHFLVLKWVFLV